MAEEKRKSLIQTIARLLATHNGTTPLFGTKLQWAARVLRKQSNKEGLPDAAGPII